MTKRKGKAGRVGEASSKAGSSGEASTKTQPEEKTPASTKTQPEEKTPASLKPELKIAKKPTSQNPTKAKESKASTESQGKPDKPKVEDKKGNIPKTKENRKGKNASKEGGNPRADDQKKSSEKFEGIIFMCNRNTKADCYKYMVMGFPEGKRELVKSIKPDMKLFLYDFDAKLLYGVYKASSSGGMKLEPSAFKGAYPAQVRFKVDLDCQPLPDDIFKKAIKENYYTERNFFKPELTSQQVKKLINLFCSSAPVQSNVLATAPSHPLPVLQAPPRPIIQTVYVPVDKELAPRSIMPAVYVPAEKDLGPKSVPIDPLSLSEKEYRMYGLKPRVAAPVAPVSDTPYAPRGEPYGTGISYRRMPYPSEAEYDHSRLYNRSGRAEVEYGRAAHEAERYPSTHEAGRYPSAHEERYRSSSRAENAPTDYNQRYELQSRADLGTSSVSSRYSFDGSAFMYR